MALILHDLLLFSCLAAFVTHDRGALRCKPGPRERRAERAAPHRKQGGRRHETDLGRIRQPYQRAALGLNAGFGRMSALGANRTCRDGGNDGRPGMPIGSAGMEGGKPEKYDLVLFGPAGRRTYMSFIGEQSV